MKFSVLIPVYKNDKPEQLVECFNSIREQTVQADEVLVLIDGPVDDNLRNVINNSSFNAHYFEKNRGLPYVLNDGIKLASHELIFRMDADDIAVADRFEKQIEYFNINQDTALLGGQIQEFLDSIEYLQGIRSVPLDQFSIAKFAKWRNPFNHPTVAFRKNIVEGLGGYNTKATYFEDYDLWVRMIAQNYKVANLPDILCYMRINNAFIQRRAGWKYLKSEMYLLKKMKELKFISLPYFLFLCSVRLPVRILPVNLLKILYRAVRKFKP